MPENTSKTAAKKTVSQRIAEASDKRDQAKASGDYVPTSDLDKDLDAANEEVQDYLEMHQIKQGEYVEDNEESEQNKKDAVEVEDHSAELSAQEVAEGAVEGQKEQRQQRAKEREERKFARSAQKDSERTKVSTGSAPKVESKS
jgi:hypothetical protein